MTAINAADPVRGIEWIIPPHRVRIPTHTQLPQIMFHQPFIMPGRDTKDPRDCAVYAAEGRHPLLEDGTCADCAAGPFTK